MKLVREHINEKFTEDSDPIRDMSIGAVNTKQNFKSEKEMFDFLTDILPAILETDKIPSDILLDLEKYINRKYAQKISNYVGKYFYINNRRQHPFNYENYHIFLKQKFPYLKSWMIKESINEKFTEDSDPIHDMGIGLYGKRNFNNVYEIVDFLIEFIPGILKTEKIPKDILLHGGSINNDYYEKIKFFFIKTKCTYDGQLMYVDRIPAIKLKRIDWPSKLRNILIESGFQYDDYV